MSSTRIVLSTTTNTKTFVQEALAGTVRFYRVRANGTTRHIPLLVEGSEDYAMAEAITEARNSGTSVAALAVLFNVSMPTVRRLIASLALTREVAGWNRTQVIAAIKSAREAEAEAATEEAPEATDQEAASTDQEG